MSTNDTQAPAGETGSTPGVTRWRKRPVDVDMILWDGSDEAWQLIASHGGQPERCTDGSINIWVEKSQAEMNLDPGAWAILESDGSGVYPCTAAAQAATYDPASSPDPAGPPVVGANAPYLAALVNQAAALVNQAADRLEQEMAGPSEPPLAELTAVSREDLREVLSSVLSVKYGGKTPQAIIDRLAATAEAGQ